MTLDELIKKVSRIERERDLYREALGRISRFSWCQASRDIADTALVKAKKMRERSSGD
jgi:hypothetical protein